MFFVGTFLTLVDFGMVPLRNWLALDCGLPFGGWQARRKSVGLECRLSGVGVRLNKETFLWPTRLLRRAIRSRVI